MLCECRTCMHSVQSNEKDCSLPDFIGGLSMHAVVELKRLTGASLSKHFIVPFSYKNNNFLLVCKYRTQWILKLGQDVWCVYCVYWLLMNGGFKTVFSMSRKLFLCRYCFVHIVFLFLFKLGICKLQHYIKDLESLNQFLASSHILCCSFCKLYSNCFLSAALKTGQLVLLYDGLLISDRYWNFFPIGSL